MKKSLFGIAIALAFSSASAVGLESKTLDQLYQDAIKEGGELIVYAGGDTPEQ